MVKLLLMFISLLNKTIKVFQPSLIFTPLGLCVNVENPEASGRANRALPDPVRLLFDYRKLRGQTP